MKKRISIQHDILGEKLEESRSYTRDALLKANGCIIGAAELLDMTIDSVKARINRHKLNHLVKKDDHIQERPYRAALMHFETSEKLWEDGLE